ncbi:hypothetical protein B0A52_00255 [Exophiala mesophila]|uniref:Calponin-homology (CH) domain-containing protein n=1 Tax=Exophiala mesophila TaxID=212818 RepID=A0A438NJJ1_EXOME|nr:hypothetical protein B0A52_00255 [Exophiala mesophila]
MYRTVLPSHTPCPVPGPQSHNHDWRRDSIQSIASINGDGDSTANIEFTSAFRTSLRGVKPRRPIQSAQRPTRQRVGAGVGSGIPIYEDSSAEQADLESNYNQNTNVPVRNDGRRDLISKPPQRPTRPVKGVAFATTSAVGHGFSSGETEVKRKVALPNDGLARLPRRPVSNAMTQQHTDLASLRPEDETVATTNISTILKPARRGTIYIPNDDTTMPSMYMGIFSPIKDLDRRDLAKNIQSECNFTGIAAQMIKKRGPRRSMLPGSPKRGLANVAMDRLDESVEVEPPPRVKALRRSIVTTDIANKTSLREERQIGERKRGPRASLMALSPKRGPLNAISAPLQAPVQTADKIGQGDGKENVPPGLGCKTEARDSRRCSITKRTTGEKPIMDKSAPFRDPGRFMENPEASTISRCYGSTASSTNKTTTDNVRSKVRSKPIWNSGVRPVTAQNAIRPKQSPPRISEHVNHEPNQKKPPVPTRFVMPTIKQEITFDEYPLLAEDIVTPSLYEDNWLGHQEIAITQLINNLFGSSTPEAATCDEEMLRIRLLDMYGDVEKATLYKRLQGALLYGALSVSSEILKASSRLNSDLGRRRAFNDLWLDTYDLSCLRAGLEVVIGRRCIRTSRDSSSSRRSSNDGGKAQRKTLQRFIETFLIRNEDGRPEANSSGNNSWSYHRTILRSLMLINVLDSIKSRESQLFSGCLFQSASPFKTSFEVVQALFQMLNPSAGDPLRALSHIGFVVHHSQYPLEEYLYPIDNIAVDLRDGVRLTRLVEILLYPSASRLDEDRQDPNSTTTVVLPSGESLSLTEGQRDWPLSQHLKFPCIGRATKLYNVQIALSALQGVKGVSDLVHDIKADDLVDGFREKTVRLLWGLASKWGLGGLVNWKDVEREIKRLCRTENAKVDGELFDRLDEEEGYARYKILLQIWAQAIGSSKGISVVNLTTSFADGRVFQAIVDEYEPHLASNGKGSATMKLSDRLKRLGCSDEFGRLFSQTETLAQGGHVFDRDFVIAALAFLSSRLLGPSQTGRAVVTIQRAWRAHLSRVTAVRKRQLKQVAEGCARVIQIRGQGFARSDGSMSSEAEIGCNERVPAWTSQPPEVEDIWLGL